MQNGIMQQANKMVIMIIPEVQRGIMKWACCVRLSEVSCIAKKMFQLKLKRVSAKVNEGQKRIFKN